MMKTLRNQFQELYIWKEDQISKHLQWYLQVTTNKKPAKFLIAKRIPVEFNSSMSTNELWGVHEKALENFLSVWHKIKGNELTLAEIEITSQSLMDLNVELVSRMLQQCNFCRWNCKVDRTLPDIDSKAKTGTCQLGEKSRVSTYFHHRGEELIFRGTNGSGTIFFTSCNLRCVFCQNGDISKDKENGQVVTPGDLAKITVLLRYEGVHNINFVGGDPIVHLHTIIKSIAELSLINFNQENLANIFRMKSDRFLNYPLDIKNAQYESEFNVPLLWNSNFFMSDEAMAILRTVIDIWLPDFKFGNNKCARRLARTPWYFETVAKTHKMLFDWGEDLSIRHLIMPNHVECCTIPIIDWLAENMPNVLVNMMNQYHPDVYINPSNQEYNPRYSDISGFPTKEEINLAYTYAKHKDINFQDVTFEKQRRKRY